MPYSWLILPLLMLLCPAVALPAQDLPQRFEAKLVSVQDGDSFSVLTAYGARERIRLSGIDAPELAQEHGPLAKQALEAVLSRGRIEVLPLKRDSFGRLVADVLIHKKDGGEGLAVARHLLLSGHAWVFTRYAKEQPPGQVREYLRAQEAAQQKQRGLWAQPDPVAPWEFRRLR
jgi:micrococcal nuclease